MKFKIKNLKFNKIKAFTLIELLIVVGITTILAGVGVSSYINQQRAKLLDTTVQEIVSYLYYAQQKSTAQEGGNQWGIHFENPVSGNDFYALYTGTTYASPEETKYLPAGITFQTPSSGNSIDMSYEKLTGILYGASYKQIILQNASGLTKNVLTCQQGLISYNSDISVCGGIDITSPIISNVAASNTSYSSYVDSPFDLSAYINEEEGGISSCQYTINNGTDWYLADISGTGPDYTCSKTDITSSDGSSLILNMKAISGGGIGTGSSISKTVDAVAPTCSDNWTDNWIVDSPVNITITSDDTGSGVASAKYCIDTPNSCSPSTSYSAPVSITCNSGSACTQYIRYAAWDNVNNTSSTYSKRVRQDKENPIASDNWTDNWTATSPVTVTISPSDGSGSGIASTYYCTDAVNTCTPTTSGTAPSLSCASDSICTQYARYYTKDNVNNTSSTYSKRVRQDKENPIASDNWTDNWTATSPLTVTITPSDGSGSGIASTYYCTDAVNTCTPTTSGTAPSLSCASGSTCTQYARYYTKDNANNNSSTYSKRVRQDRQAPTASDNWTDNWTATSPVTVTITPSDGSGSGIASTYYCTDAVNTCTPTTSGTAPSLSCASGSTCTQYARYYTKDNANNNSSTYSKRVRQDRQAPTDGTLTATPGDTQVSLSWGAASDTGSGLATSNTYKLVFSTGSSPAANCSSGTQIYLGTGNSHNHTGLTNGITYYYRVCAYDTVNNISTGASASGVPVVTCYGNGTVCSTNSQCCSSRCYRDSDGDRYAASSGTKTCKSLSSLGTDCCDSDSSANPGQSSYFTHINNCGSWDYDCNSIINVTRSGVETECSVTFPYGCYSNSTCTSSVTAYGTCTPTTVVGISCGQTLTEAYCPSPTLYRISDGCIVLSPSKYRCLGRSVTCGCK